LAACAAAVSVSALNKVDLPTLGKPTIPHRKPILYPVSLMSGRLYRLARQVASGARDLPRLQV
jgi:hypothetical protein